MLFKISKSNYINLFLFLKKVITCFGAIKPKAAKRIAKNKKMKPNNLEKITPNVPLSPFKKAKSILSGMSPISGETFPKITHMPIIINTRQKIALIIYNHLYLHK